MDIIEGKFVKMGSNYNELFEELPNNFLGHIRVSLKINGVFKDGHLFLKDKRIIGAYSDFEGELFGNPALLKIKEMAEKGAVVDVFSYTEQMLSMMKNINLKVFSLEEAPKKPVATEKPRSMPKMESGRISIPEGTPVKLGIYRDFENYFKKFTLLEVFKKISGGYLRSYFVYEGQKPVCAIFQTENGTLFGNSAIVEFKKMFDENEDLVFDVYEYSKSKLDFFIESYPDSKVLEVRTESPKREEVTKKIEYVEKEPEIVSKPSEPLEKPRVEDENISREELMKKLGIRSPKEEDIENLLEDIFEPSKTELEAIRSELFDKISDYLEENEEISEFEVNLAVTYEGKFSANCSIDTVPVYMFGVMKSNIDPEAVKSDIEDIFNDYVIDMDYKITVNVLKPKKVENSNPMGRYEINVEEEINKQNLEKKSEKIAKTEIEAFEEKVNKDISKYLEDANEISEFDLYLKLTNKNGYVANCSITVVPAKMFGFIKSNLDTEKIKKDVSEILNSNKIKIDFLNVNVEKFTTSFSKYK